MGDWEMMGEYVSRLDDGDEWKLRNLGSSTNNAEGSSDGPFFKAVLCIRHCKVGIRLKRTSAFSIIEFLYHSVI